MTLHSFPQREKTDHHDEQQKCRHHRYVRAVFSVGHADLFECRLREPVVTVPFLVEAVERFAAVTVDGQDQPFERVPHVTDVRHVVQDDGHVIEEHQETGEKNAQTGDDRTNEDAVLKYGFESNNYVQLARTHTV